jgi:hypothetical protein
MTQATKRTYLIAEKATLENLVATLHEDSVLERMGLEDRLSDVTAELASLQAAPGRTAESEVVFYGAPVRGSAGIDARFTSGVISAYQDLIAKTLAAKSELHAMGPIPDAHLSRLHVTDVVHGSFGFHFQELPEQESLGETPLFEAAEEAAHLEAAHLIDAADKDDEAFVDVVENLNLRVHDAVRTFFTTIADAGTTFRLSTARTTSEFTPDRLRAAVDRVTIESRGSRSAAARRVHGRAPRLAVIRAQARLRGGTARRLLGRRSIVLSRIVCLVNGNLGGALAWTAGPDQARHDVVIWFHPILFWHRTRFETGPPPSCGSLANSAERHATLQPPPPREETG